MHAHMETKYHTKRLHLHLNGIYSQEYMHTCIYVYMQKCTQTIQVEAQISVYVAGEWMDAYMHTHIHTSRIYIHVLTGTHGYMHTHTQTNHADAKLKFPYT